LGSSFTFTVPKLGDFINDAVMYVKLTGLSAKDAQDKVRYVEMLAHRLTKKVAFKVQDKVIDSYDSNAQNAYYNFKLPVNKEVGYLRNIGQEQPKLGYLSSNPTVDEVREYRYFGDGPQTFKQTQTTVEMWIPLLFWFRDIRHSLPYFVLAENQSDIEITFEEQSKLIAFADYGGGGLYKIPVITECCLYIHHIFTLREVLEVFMKKFTLQMIRVHRTHYEQLIDSEKSVHLQQLKWPVETMYVGFRPRVNLLNSQRWHRNTYITPVEVRQPVVTGVSTIQASSAVYLDEKHVVDRIELKTNNIVLYPSLQPDFFNAYVPFRYGDALKTPKDIGWYMINFSMFPGSFNPSGHINMSTSRELYLNYTSALDENGNYIIRSDNPADLIVVADCINFLWLLDKTVKLRFT
jgi:hypothetical protein